MINYSILVIDDEPDNYEVIEALLSSENYELQYSSNGEEAIASLDAFNPDLIILDVMMPGMDGFEVCQHIKSVSQWQAIPIIMATALSGKADLSRCLEAGADDFISKPLNGLELRARVRSMLRIKKQHDRIQSLSQLQRNNIHTLENSLNELRLDLAVAFPQELNLPLQNILDTLESIRYRFDSMEKIEIEHALKFLNRSALRIEKINRNFLFYLELSMGNKETNKNNSFSPKKLIEQFIITTGKKIKYPDKFTIDIDDERIAATPNHVQYLVSEMLDNVVSHTEAERKIQVSGKAIEDHFHFSITNRAIDSNLNARGQLHELIQFYDSDRTEQDLSIGLKIAKKIVEIYDGVFLISKAKDEITIYATLPLDTGKTKTRKKNNQEKINN